MKRERTFLKVPPSAGPEVEKVIVLDTPFRRLEILDLDGWIFEIRDTTHTPSDRVYSISLELARNELVALHRKLGEAIKHRRQIQPHKVNCYFVEVDGKVGGQCGDCAELFFDKRGKRGIIESAVTAFMAHAKTEHNSTGGNIGPRTKGKP